jgi:hypothetical protein
MTMSDIIELPSPIVGNGYLLYSCDQRSPAWHALRARCTATASDFRVARAKLKRASGDKKAGEPTDACLNLALKKALERIKQRPVGKTFTTWQMERGVKLEPYARMAHEKRLEKRATASTSLADLMIEEAGLMTTPDGVFGCSVDGLIGEFGGSEYKCLVGAEKLRNVLIENDISDYLDQVQGCMWISGRRWWHFGLYYPDLAAIGLDFHLIEVERDDDYIADLERDLLSFKRIVDDYEARLRDMGAALLDDQSAALLVESLAPLGAEEEAA